MSMFFKFAKANCCNYSPGGPVKKADYCWLEPKATNSVCLLASDKPCKWSIEAVLPLDKDLKTEWQRLRMVKLDPNPLPGTYRICACGKRFKATSNRQLRCSECGREQARASLRKRVRHHRASKVLL